MSENNLQTENRQKQRATGLSVISNLVLTVGKIFVGIISGSMSIVSEGIHSSMDLVTSLIAFFSVRKSSQPPDKDHAFGHGKYEDASGMIEALAMFVAGAIIIWEGANRVINNESAIDYNYLHLGIIVMLISTIMNFAVSQHLINVAKKTDSIALEIDGWHLRSDVLTSLGVLAGVVVLYFTHLAWIDLAIAIAIGCILLWKSFKLIRKSFGHLMDHSLSDEDIAHITRIIERHNASFTSYYGLKTRKAGPDKFIEVHITMPPNTDLAAAHQVASCIETEIKAEFSHADIVIIQEPCTVSGNEQ